MFVLFRIFWMISIQSQEKQPTFQTKFQRKLPSSETTKTQILKGSKVCPIKKLKPW